MKKKVLFILGVALGLFVSSHTLTYAAELSGIRRIKMDIAPDELVVSFLKLTSGEATLIKSEDETILVNTGSRSSRRELLKKLKVFNTKNIDDLVITNDSPSYTGNMSAIVKDYDVSKIYTSHIIAHHMCQDERLPYCFLINVWKKGTYYPLDALKTRVVSVSPSGSLNLLFTFGKTTLFHMGYFPSEEEQTHLEEHLRATQILKVADYGESELFDERFLRHIDPHVAVLYHHPDFRTNADLISQIESHWVDIYKLHQVGTVTFFLNRDGYEVKSFD
ncbi:beta-lactamase superfamily II metal-dependent hydrolase [Pullulanibacillus pueri]|uniref:MBL fold metallo-hydrolase n=1 Tax=Pullulanibacillus pueri TaxID=1437324 RepID=A0A8J3EM32_9BACL|nr:hypothetical protein [Pullulanibacillus pueri]MBM7681436.1 beta-lactamase superfamily II metal-dependent hydrolase [Pullulanibacillus pueri]GGH78870.1 hypothetical protein GCM10007096_12950 [Pullulanibacillus pueri]